MLKWGTLAMLSCMGKAVVDEILEVKEDPRLDNDWPRRYETDFVAIREGATENNASGGYWLDGTYTRILDLLGESKLEIALELHNPKQETEYVYQVWIQVVDPRQSNS